MSKSSIDAGKSFTVGKKLRIGLGKDQSERFWRVRWWTEIRSRISLSFFWEIGWMVVKRR